MVALALLVSLPTRGAWAADGDTTAGGIDAHGWDLPSQGFDGADPLTVWRPERQIQYAWSVGGVGEFASSPLVQRTYDGTELVDTQALIGALGGVHLQGSFALHERLGLGLGLPVWLASGRQVPTAGVDGPALGDVSLAVPVGLVLPAPNGEGFGLSVIPQVALPSGNAARYLGNKGLSFGGLVAAGFGASIVRVHANVGIDGRQTLDLPNQTVGGWQALAALSVGVQPTDALSVRLEGHVAGELRKSGGFDDTVGLRTGLPIEALLSVGYQFGKSGSLRAGVGRGLTNGVGAAQLRAYVAGGYTHIPKTYVQPDLQADPRFLPVVIKVVDPDGQPVPGAKIVAGRSEAKADSRGTVAFPKGLSWKGVQVSADDFLSASFQVAPGDPLASEQVVVLGWAPIEVPLAVRDERGQPVVATVSATDTAGKGRSATVKTGAVAVVPGTWRVEVGAPGFGPQARDLAVRPGADVGPLEFVLLPDEGGKAALGQKIVDPDGRVVEGAQILIDGRPVGATASGGTIEVGALSAADHKVTVRADKFTETTEVVALHDGLNNLEMTLRRMPGTVRVIARTPEGPVDDATVRFDGPSRLEPSALGGGGERIFGPLRPGTWTVSVISPTAGVSEREITVEADDFDLAVVDVVLLPEGAGSANVALRIVDPDGFPVEGAQVVLDTVDLGTMSAGGTLVLPKIEPGIHKLGISADFFREVPVMDLLVTDGPQEKVLTMEWLPGTTWVRARDAEGPVSDVVVKFAGPESPPATPLGFEGESYFTLRDGDWNALLTSAEAGLAERSFQIPEDNTRLTKVDVFLAADEGGESDLALTVRNKQGEAVDGAQVFLDGSPLGSTIGGGLQIAGLSAGRRQLKVTDGLYQSYEKAVDFKAGTQKVKVDLDWGVGALEVVAKSPKGAVTDAIVRLVGPEPVAPVRVDADGSRLFSLTPGTWQAVVISESWGIGEKTITIPDKPQLTTAEFILSETPDGFGELLVRVVDPDGHAVKGAVVAGKDGELGKTGDGGAALLSGLFPGPLELTVKAEDFADQKLASKIVEGSQERIVELAWLPGSVRVKVADQAGNPVDAKVHFDGPAQVADGVTGLDGEELFQLRPGTWQVVASTATLGPQRAELVIDPAKPGINQVSLVLEPTKVELTAVSVVIKEQVNFEFDSANLTAGAGRILDEVANTLVGNPKIIRVEVQGHTDDKGTVAYNQELSQRRAEAVVKALVARGVAPERLIARGYGTQRPLTENVSDVARAANRRVQFEIIEQSSR